MQCFPALTAHQVAPLGVPGVPMAQVFLLLQTGSRRRAPRHLSLCRGSRALKARCLPESWTPPCELSSPGRSPTRAAGRGRGRGASKAELGISTRSHSATHGKPPLAGHRRLAGHVLVGTVQHQRPREEPGYPKEQEQQQRGGWTQATGSTCPGRGQCEPLAEEGVRGTAGEEVTSM